eukprot:8847234-Pyramimonas_sp.AAC.3
MVDGKGYMVDAKGYRVDSKGYRADAEAVRNARALRELRPLGPDLSLGALLTPRSSLALNRSLSCLG